MINTPDEKINELFFEEALLPTGWAKNVLICINPTGSIISVNTNVEAKERILLPGLVLPGITNLHCHAHQRAIAGLSEHLVDCSDNFWTWRHMMYQHLEKIQPNHLNAIAGFLYLEMVKAGYTSVAEFQYLHHDVNGHTYQNRAEMSIATISAAKEIGIGMTILPVLFKYSGFGSIPALNSQCRFVNNTDDFLKIFNDLCLAVNNDGNLNIGIAPHSLRAIDTVLLDQVLEGINIQNLPIHIHIAEQEQEVYDCLEWCGQRPVERLFENFDVNKNWCLVHATHMNDHETSLLAKSKAVAGLCPTTEANLGDGLFNAKIYFAENGDFGIGSDSNVTIDPFDELRWLEYGQRLHHRSRNILSGEGNRSTGRNLFELATIGGAKAIGRKSGKIDVGYKADFIVVDTDHPSLRAREEDAILDNLIFLGRRGCVQDVFVNGIQIIQQGNHRYQTEILKKYVKTVDELARL